MGGLRSSLWALVIVAFAQIDRAIASQLPLPGNDIMKDVDLSKGHDVANGAVNGELRRYPFASALLEEFQVRTLHPRSFLRI
jgi:hypothetical protein